ncbi:PEFG-CTERM sorting domain-containing protein [Candidatus Nitrosotenuis aquarius]|uniref:PEFG-CTERM sorting domain-containing protein n=1 Tax=Candidatus Nitrosotenuis aquarius TaxID=1846278 RepID=UPI000C1E510B|nr:PEFG-CTERM sorting domain-containing protein [Candidatus Nitrosotenuis aquarius]
MNSYALSVLIAIMAAAGTLAIVPTYASTFDEEACPDCGSNDIYTKANLAAQNDLPIAVWTDSRVYDHESEVVVSGTVANIKPGFPVTVTVIGPQNNIVSVHQVEVSEDNTFETVFSTSSALFKANGMYTVRAQYGPQEINDKVMIELVGEAPMGEVACGDGELAVKGGGEVYCVPFEADGVVVTGSSVSSATKSLILKIETEGDGFVSLAIPRDVLDATEDGSDVDFIVLVDDEEADYEEVDSDDSTRWVEIIVPDGASQIEIIGTYAVPEFGTMAAIILAVAIVSIIAVSARTRLSISPRY